ncbi:MAG: hypothetical protein Q7K11_00725 [Candidatus Berkelbacteria bacterium]|nr:hypothetical protein [Candidatus Berkelbacteria bacterium]
MQADTKKRVGILRGGAGEHYNASLKKGGDIILYIQENLSEKYKPIDILIDKDYIWHYSGIPVSPSELAHKIDLAWNVSHPSLSNILESLSIPNIGTSAFLGNLANSRDVLKEHLKSIGINMPRHIVLPLYQSDFDGPREAYVLQKAKKVFEKFGSPWIIRSFVPYSNMAVHLCKTFPQLVDAIEDGLNHETSILVEEFIVGKVASVHSVAGFRGEDVYTFPPLNIFGNISGEEKEKLIGLAKNLHNHLGAKHYLKSSFVLHPRGKIYLMHIDSVPDFKTDSYFSAVCDSVGAKTHELIDHILERALS